MYIGKDPINKLWETHLYPDLLLLIHCQHSITDHVIHQVSGFDVLLQLVPKA